jgi:hypothetical protein
MKVHAPPPPPLSSSDHVEEDKMDVLRISHSSEEEERDVCIICQEKEHKRTHALMECTCCVRAHTSSLSLSS